MKMKKMLIGAFLGMFAVAGVAVLPNYASAQTDWANPNAEANLVGDGNQTLTGSAFLNTVKNAINWLLGILATVALVFCLYGGFQMVTSAGDEKKYSAGLNVLKYAAIGLAIIGLSWMIVSIIFWFVSKLGDGNQTGSQDVQNITTDGEGTSIRGSNGGGNGGGGD